MTTKIPKKIMTVVEPDLYCKGFGLESLIYHRGTESEGHFISVIKKSGVLYVTNNAEVVVHKNLENIAVSVHKQRFLLVAAIYKK